MHMRLKSTICTFAAASALAAACTPQSASLSFEARGLNADSIRLVAGNSYAAVPYDSTGAVTLSLENFGNGYASLQFGRTNKLVYLEAGQDLSIRYERSKDLRQSPYIFQGDLADENHWLESHERMSMINFKQAATSADAIRLIEDSVSCRLQALESQAFSSKFIEIEKRREAVATYRTCRNYPRWDAQLYPFLQKHVQGMPELFICDDYRTFISESLGALASGDYPDFSSYGYIEYQLKYLAAHFQNPVLRSYFASTAVIAYLEQYGAQNLDALLEITRPLVSVPANKARTADIFRKWKRMEKGSPIEDYTFKDMQDKEVRLSDFEGKYIFIDCWATWCGPCRAQVAPLRQLEEDYEGKNIVFIGVSSDSDRDKWKAFVKEQKLPGIQVNIPANHPFYEHFAVSGIPRFIVITPERTVHNAMFPRPSEPECRQLLDEIL